jgi:signal transduction histidine kinase
MERHYEDFKRKLDATAAFMMTIQAQLNQQHSDTVTSLRRFEYLIGAGIALMVLGVATYGLWVGRIMKAKFIELELTRAEAQSFAEDLQRVNSDLGTVNRDLADNMRKLSEAQDEIIRRGKLAQLGRLTAAMARELRNPLGAMRTSAFLIDRKLKDREYDIAPQLQRVNNGIARCDRIVSQLMDLALSRQPQREMLPVDDWLAKIIEEGAEKFSAGVDIECRLGLGATRALFDAGLMARVIAILMDNAVHAVLERKDRSAQSQAEAPRIVIDTQLSPRGAAISISDNGPGVPADLLERIREPLFSTKKDGVGLGLPIAEKILAEHSGGLDISSTSEGSTFTAWIPLAKDQRKAA